MPRVEIGVSNFQFQVNGAGAHPGLRSSLPCYSAARFFLEIIGVTWVNLAKIAPFVIRPSNQRQHEGTRARFAAEPPGTRELLFLCQGRSNEKGRESGCARAYCSPTHTHT